jgi:alanine racemase
MSEPMTAADRPRLMEIDLDALAHNYRALRALAGPGLKIIAALKGNAYGHGAARVAGCLAQFDVHAYSTGSLEDALAIRSAVPDAPVVMFGGPLPEGLPLLVEHGLTPTVYSMAGAEAVSRAATRSTGVYVKVDAGLGRLGVPLSEALEFVRRIEKLEHVTVEGMYTHLPFGDAESQAWASERLAAFDELLVSLEGAGIEIPTSQALASSGLLVGLKSRANAVCPGHLLYGISPVPPELAELGPFKPVLRSIKSCLIHVHEPGGTPSRVGVIPLGLVDGYLPPLPGSGAHVLIDGRPAPIKGPSLEYMSLDLSDHDTARVGDEVVLLGASGGAEITIEDVATWRGGFPHHVLMSFNQRLPCRYIGG